MEWSPEPEASGNRTGLSSFYRHHHRGEEADEDDDRGS